MSIRLTRIQNGRRQLCGTTDEISLYSFKKILNTIKIWKAGRFEKILDFARSHSIVTGDSVSLMRHHATPFLLF